MNYFNFSLISSCNAIVVLIIVYVVMGIDPYKLVHIQM